MSNQRYIAGETYAPPIMVIVDPANFFFYQSPKLILLEV
jgi:hypothetical protein